MIKIQHLVGWGLCASASVVVAQVPATQPAVQVAAGPAESSVQCHVTAARITRTFVVAPSTLPAQQIPPLLEGAALLLQVINRTAPAPDAGITVRMFGTNAQRPYLLHQAFYPPASIAWQGPHGFSGLQTVREPDQQSEVSYWCTAWAPAPDPAKVQPAAASKPSTASKRAAPTAPALAPASAPKAATP